MDCSTSKKNNITDSDHGHVATMQPQRLDLNNGVHLTPLCTIAPKKTNSRKYCSEPDPVLPRISDLVAARMKLTVRKHCSQSGGPSKKDKDEASGADK